MRKNPKSTLSFHLSDEQKQALAAKKGAPDTAQETTTSEPPFRPWNAAFVDCEEPLPE